MLLSSACITQGLLELAGARSARPVMYQMELNERADTIFFFCLLQHKRHTAKLLIKLGKEVVIPPHRNALTTNAQ